MRNPRFLNLKKLGILLVLFPLAFANLRAADADLAATNSPEPDAVAGPSDFFRAVLQIQEQLHATQLTVERNRQEAQAVAAQDALALSNRLQAIEQSVAAQRTASVTAEQRTNNLLFVVIGVFAVGILGVVAFVVYFQSRAVNRLADISTALSAGRGLPMPEQPALPSGESDVIPAAVVEQSNARLLGLVQNLEERIADLEQTAGFNEEGSPTVEGNGTASVVPEITRDPAVKEGPGQLAKLLEQGQALLAGDRPEEAIACFDAVLAAEPGNADALVKKGSALEKMRQPQEALEYYDRAIAANNTLTIAYLHKGGLCSRLEKYTEAMECYERALHTQEKKQAA